MTIRVIPIMFAALLVSCSHKDENEDKPKALVSVKVAAAELADLGQIVKAPASLFPREQANISARITAPIRSIAAKKGDGVQVNDIVATLENRDLLAAQQEAEAVLQDAESNLQKVESGAVPADLERARGETETAQATLNQAQKAYDRRNQLFNEGAIPGRDLLQAETDLAKAKTAYDVAKRFLVLLQTQSSAKDIAIAQARVEQARARLNASKAQVAFTELRAPFSGTVTDQMQYTGDLAAPSAPTLTIMDLSIVNARAQVSETDVGRIRTGQACQFTPADSTMAPAEGKVTVMNRAVDPQRRTVEVWCELENRNRSLRANVFGAVAFAVGSSRGVTVPQSAVLFVEGAQSGTVMVVDAKHIAHQREIESGTVVDGKVQVLKGVAPGELIVTEGGYGLPDGSEVTWKSAK